MNNDFKEVGGIQEPEAQSSSNETTPVKKQASDSAESNSPTQQDSPQTPVAPVTTQNQSSGSGSGKKTRYKGKGLDANGRPRNFYNPPGKVLRSLQNQSYYDSFYGSQGQVYTLKQKYKTQLCKHYLEEETCPLQQFCQFAHGPNELRQPNDPLPETFGKTALGAVHSNYKTEPCRYMEKEEKCPFGDNCSFFHDDEEKRKLIDPLPNLPEGVTLPPMPEKVRHHPKGRYNHNYNNGHSKNYYNDYNQYTGGSPSVSPFQFSPLNQQPPSVIQITSFAEMAAFGGFNPNKYLSPAPISMQAQIQGLQFNGQPPAQMFVAQTPQMQVQQMYQQQMMQNNQGNQAPGQNNGNQHQGQNNKHGNKGGYQNNFKPGSPKKNAQHRYEKKDQSGQNASKNGKKGDKNQSEQKKYVTKQQKNPNSQSKKVESPAKTADAPAKTEAPAKSEQPVKAEATKAVDNAASQ